MPFDWREFQANGSDAPAVVDPRRRLRVFRNAFLLALLVVFARTVQLEVTQGAGFRAEALRPIERETLLPAARGQILARDGTVLAHDETVAAVAVHYRWLQQPPEARWLRAAARARLNKADRRSPQKVAEAQAAVTAERAALAERLTRLYRLSPDQWAAETRRIQSRVERVAASVNRRRPTEVQEGDDSWATRIRRLLLEDPPPPRIVVAEELAYHVVASNVPKTAVAEIAAHADQYPGVKLVEVARRDYPCGTLAAHVLGYLGRIEEDELDETPSAYLPEDLVGRTGVERQQEAVLRGRRGLAIEQSDHSGRTVAAYHASEPVAGCNVMLSLDPSLQRTAEELLRGAMERRAITGTAVSSAGGAIVAMDVRDGSIRAAASWPTFDPNTFARSKSDEIASLLTDQTHPLFPRACSMAIPPGSAFKVLTAIALLESGTVDPEQPFVCQGYLHKPDRQRCQIYIRQGVGHGSVTLTDALAQSCNVYFFHFAGLMGSRPLLDWGDRLGFGQPTGIDLPGEASGTLPAFDEASASPAKRTADAQAMAIGQGTLTATPLQVARMMAAVANGGKLVVPHIVQRVEGGPQNVERETESPNRQGEQFVPLSPRTLRTVREGLGRVVADPKGTAHGTVYIESIAVAGKTGTAETGDEDASHAWFAGYAPADAPKIAFVIVLERAGDAAVAAGPLAKRLVLRMDQLGML